MARCARTSPATSIMPASQTRNPTFAHASARFSFARSRTSNRAKRSATTTALTIQGLPQADRLQVRGLREEAQEEARGGPGRAGAPKGKGGTQSQAQGRKAREGERKSEAESAGKGQ